jgi:hypothetical protein
LLELKVPIDTLKPAALNAPSVRVRVPVPLEPSCNASASVTVIPEPLIVVAPSALPALVTVADARNVGTTAVYVPPEASVKLPPIVTLLAVTVLVLPVKIKSLKKLPLVIVSADAPALTVRLGAFDTVPPGWVPKATVAVAAILRVKPPVPVNVKLVEIAMLNTVVEAVVLVSAMLPAPNEIARVDVPEEEKIPVLRVKPARLRVP